MFPVPTKPTLPELPEFAIPRSNIHNSIENSSIIIVEARTERAVQFLQTEGSQVGKVDKGKGGTHEYVIWLDSIRQSQAQAVRQYLLDAWGYFLATGEYPTTKESDNGNQ